ncbi:hypothetical protein ACUXST_001224 [Sphingomonas sp. F9_3S_D5_B_2]
MSARSWMVAASVAALMLAGCKSEQPPASTGTTVPAGTDATGTTPTGSTGTDAGATAGTGTTTGAGTDAGTSASTGTSIPTLVNVNLQNVLNDLSVSLQVNRNNIPVSAQVPIEVAANVCGVSVSALAASIASGQAGCTATTASPQLTQLVQQQIASGGSVTGGPQTMGGTPQTQ